MNIVNKVRVTICGKDYSLQTDETPEYIAALAAKTEKQIYDLVRKSPGFGLQNAAVFVALTSLDEANKAEKSIEDIRGQIKSSMTEAGKARAAKEKLAGKIKELESRISELEKENKELEKENHELKKLSPAFGCEQLVLENTISPSVTVYTGETSADADGKTESSARSADGETGMMSAKPIEENQSSGNSSGDLVSRSSEGQEQKAQQKTGEAAAASEDVGQAPDHDRGGAAEAQGNGDSSQNDNLNRKSRHGNAHHGKGAAK